MQLRGCEFISEAGKHSACVTKYIREREQYGECNTKYWNLLLRNWWNVSSSLYMRNMRMDIELLEELLSMVEPLIQRNAARTWLINKQIDTKYEKNIVGLVVSCRLQIPLYGLTDFVCDPTRPTDKIRTCRDWTDKYTTRQSADLSDTGAYPIGLCWRPGRLRQSGRARLVEFGHNQSHRSTQPFIPLG